MFNPTDHYRDAQDCLDDLERRYDGRIPQAATRACQEFRARELRAHIARERCRELERLAMEEGYLPPGLRTVI